MPRFSRIGSCLVLFTAIWASSTDAAERPIAAPVFYQEQMLIVTTVDGVAAVAFGDEINSGVEYEYRFLSRKGKKETSGTGQLMEKKLVNDPMGRTYDPRFLFIKAGTIRLEWSKGGPGRGYVYYTPEKMTVQTAVLRSFRDEVLKGGLPRGPVVIKKLDLRRFLKKKK